MHKFSSRHTLSLCAVAAIVGGCSGGASAPPLGPSVSMNPLTRISAGTNHNIGLGKVLSSKNGGQIFGYDIDRNSSDGVIATATDVETFDQGTGKITAAFPKKLPPGTSYKVDGIFAGDVALVTRYVVPSGKIFAKRFYNVMKPVTAKKFTGAWTEPIKDIDVLQAGVNQTTTTSALFAIALKHLDNPEIVVTNVGANTVSKVISLDPNLFGGGNGPQFDQDFNKNQGVIALSPDGGRVGGSAPINVLVDLSTSKQTQFTGLNNGPFGAGYVNGLAVDSKTGIAATTTELNAQVEFYDLAKQTGISAQLPCTGNAAQINSGSGLANDPVNGLFLVTEQYYACGGNTSAIIVFNEKGAAVETITGFKFYPGQPAPVVNPSTRTGWVFGPGFNQLQEFSY